VYNHNVDARVAARLRKLGHDAWTAADAGLSRVRDDEFNGHGAALLLARGSGGALIGRSCRRVGGRRRWRALGVYGGDPLACTGEVLTLVPRLPRARPEQDQGWGGLVSPLEPAGLIPVGRIGVRGGVRVTYSDVP
jgi:hypothetical protein